MPLGPTPGEHQLHHGECARTQREPGGKTVAKMAESQIITRQRHASLIRHELESKRTPDRMLKTFLQQQQIRRTIPVVLIATQRHRSVDILTSHLLLKIKWHGASSRVDRF